MARQITFSVPDGIYDSIQEYMKDEGLPFVAPLIKSIIIGFFGTKFNLHKQDMSWFKHAYFVRNQWGLLMREYSKLYGKDDMYYVLSAMMSPINTMFFHSLDSDHYPLTNDQDAKLDDIALIYAEMANKIKMDDCHLNPKKVAEKLKLNDLWEE